MEKDIKITGVRVKRHYEQSDYLTFPLSDVNYVTNEEEILIFHTVHGEFHGLLTLEDVESGWKEYGFLALDSVNVVNMNNVVGYDEELRYVYFKNGDRASVSIRRGKKYLKGLRKKS